MSKPPSARYRTTNWSSYNASLRKRGSLLIWVDKNMTWRTPHEGRPGRQPVFSDAAIQFCLSIKVLFNLPLRQTAGMVASLLKLAGLAAGILMILASKSRMGLVGLVACTITSRLMPLILRGWAWHAMAAITASLAVLGTALVSLAQDAVATFKGARADSTRVRETLQRIAHERWQNEAVWFGHGKIHPGSHIVEYMPIGSHHTWYGLLFVKGLVGFTAFLIPMLWHTGLAMIDAARTPRGRLPMGILMTMILLSFGENIEIEAYMLWPGLVLLGVHLREMGADISPTTSSPSGSRRHQVPGGSDACVYRHQAD
ncbi:transposase [Roseovarius ramblicola]|uniref:Transposase n=1 Tax=Roseovarius ramblicola TaxID=2022336 RepID=A0ABV5I4J2_9RHOB